MAAAPLTPDRTVQILRRRSDGTFDGLRQGRLVVVNMNGQGDALARVLDAHQAKAVADTGLDRTLDPPLVRVDPSWVEDR